MTDLFPTTVFRKHFNQLIKFNKEYIEGCEITPNISPFDVSDVDEYYKRIEQWDTLQLRWKINRCRIASSVKGIYDDLFIDEIRENIPSRFFIKKKEDLPTIRARCKIALRELKIAEKKILSGAYTKSPRYGIQIHLGEVNVRGFDLKEAEILKEGCKFILKDEGAEYLRKEVCPIAMDNALALHYEINRRNVEKGFYDMDIKSGMIVRDIERNCIDFPLVKNIPYIKKGKEILRLRVQVNQEPDSSGRIGRISILKPIKKPERISILKPIKKPDITDSAEVLYNRLNEIKRKRFLNKILDYSYGSGFRHPQTFYNKDKRVQEEIRQNRDLLVQIWAEEVSYINIGSESCVWAKKTRPAAQFAKETAEISKAEYEARDPLELAEITERFMRSLETMERGIIDAHPRQDLFDSAVSTFEAWVEYDFDPNVIEPMLANMLYQHIGRIDPRLVSKNLILLIEDQIERGYERWDWIEAWLNKYDNVREALSVNDWRYIVKAINKPLTSLLNDNQIHLLMSDMTDKENIAFKKEFLNIEAYYKELKDLSNDKDFMKKWNTHIKYPLNIGNIYSASIMALRNIKVDVKLIKKELEIQRKGWKERTPYEEWIDSFIEVRDKGEINTRGKEVGLAVRAFVSESGSYLHVGVKDHYGNYWSGFWTSDPAEWFGGDWVREKWGDMSKEERIQWSVDNADIDIDIFNKTPEKGKESTLDRIFMDNFYWKEMPCWDYENTEWDEECVLDHVAQNIGEYEWSIVR